MNKNNVLSGHGFFPVGCGFDRHIPALPLTWV